MEPIGLIVALNGQRHPAPFGHPESVDRLQPAADLLRRQEELLPLSITPHESSVIDAVHGSDFLQRLRRFAEQGGGDYDADTYVQPGSWSAALEASDAVLSAVDAAFGGGPRKSIVIARPPGHHAETARAMGFCLINQVAVAARYAIDHHHAARVAIVDFDVHHGNGSQEIFYEEPDVMFISSHQYPFYPGTGSAGEAGRGRGEGYTRNFPLRAGTGDSAVRSLYETQVYPLLDQFRPDVILVSAGFDGHRDDPLAGLEFIEKTYNQLGSLLAGCAGARCAGRLISYVEGGYNPIATRDSILSYVRGIQQQ